MPRALPAQSGMHGGCACIELHASAPTNLWRCAQHGLPLRPSSGTCSPRVKCYTLAGTQPKLRPPGVGGVAFCSLAALRAGKAGRCNANLDHCAPIRVTAREISVQLREPAACVRAAVQRAGCLCC